MSKVSYTTYGGSWYDYQALTRAVSRYFIHPDLSNGLVGFRAVEEHGIHVVRSGAGHRVAALARVVDRNGIHPVHRYLSVGFRIMEGL